MTEKNIKENFSGLSDFINDEDILNWYYSLVDISVTETAKGFAEWILKEGYHGNNGYWWFDSTYYTTEQLYEIFKNK